MSYYIPLLSLLGQFESNKYHGPPKNPVMPLDHDPIYILTPYQILESHQGLLLTR